MRAAMRRRYPAPGPSSPTDVSTTSVYTRPRATEDQRLRDDARSVEQIRLQRVAEQQRAERDAQAERDAAALGGIGSAARSLASNLTPRYGIFNLAMQAGGALESQRARAASGEAEADYAQNDGFIERSGDMIDRSAMSAQGGIERFMTTLLPGGRAQDALRARVRPVEAAANSAVAGETTWDDVKADPLSNLLPFVYDTALGSAVEMGITATPGVGMAAESMIQTGRIGQQRAAADGRRDADFTDSLVAAPFGIGSTMLERLGIGEIAGAAGRNALVRTGRAALTEGGTEGGESFLEYTGGALGTEQGFDPAEALDQTLGGAVGGAGMGAGFRAGGEGVNALRNRRRPAAPITQEDVASPIPDDLIAEGRAIVGTATGDSSVIMPNGPVEAGGRVDIHMPNGSIRTGTLETVGDMVSVAFDDGTRLEEPLENLVDAGVQMHPGAPLSDADIIDAQLAASAASATSVLPTGPRVASAPARERQGQGISRPAGPNVPPGGYNTGLTGDAAEQFKRHVRRSESGGNDNAANPRGSASGRYQFIESTFRSLYQRVYGATDTQAAAAWSNNRFDPQVQERLMDAAIGEYTSAFRRAGVPATAGNLYLAHFLGPAGAVGALRVDPRTPAINHFGERVVNSNPEVMRGKTVGDVIAWTRRRMGGAAPGAGVDTATGDIPAMPDLQMTEFDPVDFGDGPQRAVIEPIPMRAEERRDTAVTTTGREVPVQYAVVELRDLIASNDADGNPNPAFPTERQPRDRTRVASRAQVQDIAANLNPRLLGRSPKASDGAPIISPDGVVESGNGRTIALQLAYANGGERADAYRQMIEGEGFDTAGMDQPVLVRARDANMAPEDVDAFIREANSRDTAAMSGTESAESDAGAMPAAMLDLYRGGDIDAAGNRDFVRAFMGAVVPVAEQGQMVLKDGQIAKPLLARIEAAVLVRAFGRQPFVEKLVDATDSNIRTIGKALIETGGSFAKLREAAADGRVDEAMDISAHISEAVEIVDRARRESRPVASFVQQRDIFSGEAVHPLTEAVLRMMYARPDFTKPVSQKRLVEALRYYLQEAEKAAPGGGLFGESTKATPDAILQLANDRSKQAPDEGDQPDLLRTGQSDGSNGGGVPASGGNDVGPGGAGVQAQSGEQGSGESVAPGFTLIEKPSSLTVTAPDGGTTTFRVIEKNGAYELVREDDGIQTQGWTGRYMSEGPSTAAFATQEKAMAEARKQVDRIFGNRIGEIVGKDQSGNKVKSIYGQTNKTVDELDDNTVGSITSAMFDGIALPDGSVKVALTDAEKSALQSVGIAHVGNIISQPDVQKLEDERQRRITKSKAGKNASDAAAATAPDPSADNSVDPALDYDSTPRDERVRIMQAAGVSADMLAGGPKRNSATPFDRLPDAVQTRIADYLRQNGSAPVPFAQDPEGGTQAQARIEPGSTDKSIVVVGASKAELAAIAAAVPNAKPTPPRKSDGGVSFSKKHEDKIRAALEGVAKFDANKITPSPTSESVVGKGGESGETAAPTPKPASGGGSVDLVYVSKEGTQVRNLIPGTPAKPKARSDAHAEYLSYLEKAEREGRPLSNNEKIIVAQSEARPLGYTMSLRPDGSLSVSNSGFMAGGVQTVASAAAVSNDLDGAIASAFENIAKRGDDAKPVVESTTKPAESEAPSGSAEKSPPNTRETPAKLDTSPNRLVTDDRAAELRAKINAKLNPNRLNAGIDPELMMLGAELGIYHIERGARRFTAFATAIAGDLGVKVKDLRQHLRSWYNGARDQMEDMGESVAGMDTPDEVAKAMRTIDQWADAEPVTEAAEPATEGNDVGPSIYQDGTEPLAGASPEPLPGAEGERDAGPRSATGKPGSGVTGGAANGGRDAATGSGGNGTSRPDNAAAGKPKPVKPKPEKTQAELFLTDPSDAIEAASPINVPGADFVITDDVALGQGTELVKFEDNIAAIETLKKLETENRRASPAEQRTLARYVGWGGLKNAFRVAGAAEGEGIAKGWEKRVAQLEELLTPAELRAARNSTTAAHYTSQTVVQAMWKAAERLGFNGGAVLEPSVGTGNFLGLMPESLRGGSSVLAVEYDSLTARIAQNLYPNATVLHSGLQDLPLPQNQFALAIGNPPFGRESLFFPYNAAVNGKSIHNQFFLASLDSVAEGGIMAMVVSHNLMDALDPSSRYALAAKAEFLGGIRLPDTAFKENARTEVVTDMLFFRKRTSSAADIAEQAVTELQTGKAPESQLGGYPQIKGEISRWTRSEKITDPAGSGETINANTYFTSSPAMVIGTINATGTMNARADLNVTLEDPSQFKPLLDKAIERLPKVSPRDDLVARTTKHFAVMADAMRLAARRAEVGAVEVDVDGNLKMVVDFDAGDAGKSLKREIALTENTPFADDYTLSVDGKWQRSIDMVGEDGKPVKVMSGNKATNRNRKEVVTFERESDIPAKDRWGKDRIAAVRAMLPIKNAMKRQFTLESQGATDAMIDLNRKALNKAYDDFVAKHGKLHDSKNVRIAMMMPDGALALAAETNAGTAKAPKVVKADIMSRRVAMPPQVAESAQDASEAVGISLSEIGRIDLARIAKLLGTDEAGAEKALSAGDEPAAFFDPEESRWESRDQYLSGLVRRKMNMARAAGLDSNVKALEAVMPEDWTMEQITPIIGSAWIPGDVYADFYKHLGFSTARVSYSAVTNTFSVAVDGEPEAQWQTSLGHPPQAIVMRLLNTQSMKVVRKDGDGKTYTDEEATTESEQKAAELYNEFLSWAFSDEARAQRLVSIFNEKFNTRLIRQRDGSHLNLYGKVPDAVIKMRRHQMNGIWRGITDRSVLYDHVVGAGKTFTAIARVMERRRMGLSQKPMIVVPNHLVEQWAKDVKALYPGANVIAAGKADFERKNRRRLFARIASSDFDMVIIGHSSFGFIDLDRGTEERYLNEELSAAQAGVKEAQEAADEMGLAGWRKPMGVAEAERLVKKIEERLARLRNSKRDRLLTFEEMGIDDLTIDEAHEFKNLAYTSRLQNVSGMGNKVGSQKAMDLHLKVRSLAERPGTSTAFLTGTPISNSVAEMYLILRNLAPLEMKEMGIENFDAWRSMFVSYGTAWEPTEAGGVKEVNRLGREWSNMRALMDLYYSVADAVTMGDIVDAFSEDNPGKKFPIPDVVSKRAGKGDREAVVVEPDDVTAEMLREVVSDFRNLPSITDPKERNAARLRLMDRARKISLDPRAVSPNNPAPTQGGKIRAVTDRVAQIYRKWDADKGTQIIFLDRSVPKAKGDDKIVEAYDALRARLAEAVRSGDDKAEAKLLDDLEKYNPDEMESLRAALQGGWNAYDEIKRQLVAQGIPENEVRFVQEASTDQQKLDLFALVKSGAVRVLIGSTPRMGAGTNVQDRLVGLHHVDVTWKPSDIEQREGRIVRQGNKLLDKYGDDFAVEVIAYTTARTVDAKMWDLNASKLKAINGIRKYDGWFQMEFEDEESASMAEMAALATGDPLMIERVTLDTEIKKLELKQRSFNNRQNAMRSKLAQNKRAISSAPSRIAMYEDFANEVEIASAAVQARSAARSLTVQGRSYSSRNIADDMAQAAIATIRGGDATARFSIEVGGKKVTTQDQVGEALHAAFGTPGFEGKFNNLSFIHVNDMAKQLSMEASEAAANAPSFTMDKIKINGMSVELDVAPGLYVNGKRMKVLTLSAMDQKGRTVVSRDSMSEGASVALMRSLIEKMSNGLDAANIRTAAKIEQRAADKAASEIAGLEAEVEKPFADEEALADKRTRLQDVVAILAEKEKTDTKQSRSRSMPGTADIDPVALRERLKALGLSDKVSLAIVDSLSGAAGDYGAGGQAIIRVARDTAQAGRFTLDHEAIHALREMGLFSKSEWSLLTAAAKRDAALMRSIARRYSDLDAEAQLEEAVSDMFARWSEGQTQTGMIVRLFQRLRDLFDAIRNSVRGDGFASAGGVMRAVDRGDVGRRETDFPDLGDGQFFGGPSQSRAYENAPDGLMGFAKDGSRQKSYGQQGYRYNQPVRVTLPGGETFTDEIMGLNPAHALERARRNWPDSDVQADGEGAYTARQSRVADTSDLTDAVATGVRAKVDAALDVFRTKMQDRYLPLLRVQQRVESATGKPLPLGANPYLREELMTGRMGNQLERFSDNMIDPLFTMMHQSGVTPEELETFLYARHAPERNAQIAKINPKMPDGGSGMSDIEAAAIMNRVKRSGRIDKLEAIASIVDDINQFALKTRIDAGLLSADEAKAWSETYQHYVPLRGQEEVKGDATGLTARVNRSGGGLTVTGKEAKRAYGRRSHADNILAYTLLQAEEAIVRAETNRVAQAFVNLAQRSPDPDYWEVNKVTRKAVMDSTTGLVRYENQSRIQMEDKDFTVTAKVDGEEIRVTMNRYNPSARRLADSMRNLTQHQVDWIVHFLGVPSRFLSAVNTSWNPEFIITNAFRDIQSAALNIAGLERDKLLKGTMRDYRKALVAATKGEFGKGAGEWSRWYNEFKAEGGATYFNRIDNLDDLKKRIANGMTKAEGRLSVKRGFLAVRDTVEALNGGVENAVRLSVYKNARELGVSKAEAASIAKNVTVNFNRRGQFGPMMNAAYMFFNASVQGTARLVLSLRSKRVQKVMAGVAVGAFMLELLNAMLSDDDDDGESYYDKISAFDKNRNFIFMIPGGNGEHIKIPMPYGYNVFASMGRTAAEVLRRGGDRAVESMGDFGTAVVDAFNPVGGTESLLNLLSPTLTDPLVDLTRNRDYMDRPIMPEENQYGPDEPDAQRYHSSVSPIWRAVTDTLTSMTGGDDIVAGAIDVSPETLEYLAGTVFGAAGGFIQRIGTWGTKALDPDVDVEMGDIVLVRKVLAAKPSWYDRSAYYDRVSQVEQTVSDAGDYLEIGDRERFESYVNSNEQMLTLEVDMKAARRDMRAIRKAKGELELGNRLGHIDDATYRRESRVTRDAEDIVIQRFNTRWNEVMHPPRAN